MADAIWATRVKDPSVETDDGEPTWGDWGAAFFKVGVPETAASVTSLVRAGAEEQMVTDRQQGETRDPMLHATAGVAKVLGDTFTKYADDSSKELSPAMQKDLEASFSSEHFWEHPVRTVAAQGIRTLPTAGLGVAAGLLTPAGPWAAVVMAGATNGGLEASQTVQQFYQITDSLDDEQLQAQSKYYKGLREQGLGEQEAREDFNQKFRGMAPLYVAALGAVTGVAGPAGQIVRGVKGVGHAGNMLTRIGKAAGEGFAAEGLQEGQQQHLQQTAEIREGFQKEYDPQSTFDNAAMGALIGGVLGAPGGVFKAKGAAEAEPVAGENPGGPPPPTSTAGPTEPAVLANANTSAPAQVTPKVTPAEAVTPAPPVSGGAAPRVRKPSQAKSTADPSYAKDEKYKEKWRTRRKYRTGEQPTYAVTPGAPDATQAAALAATQPRVPIGETGPMDVGPVPYPGAETTVPNAQPDVNFGPAPQGYLEQAAAAREQAAAPVQPQAAPAPQATAPVQPQVAEAPDLGTPTTPQEAAPSEAPTPSTEELIAQGNHRVATAEERRGSRVLKDLSKPDTPTISQKMMQDNMDSVQAKLNRIKEKAAGPKKGHGDKARTATRIAKNTAAEAVFAAEQHQVGEAENDFAHPNENKALKAQQATYDRAKSIVTKFESTGNKVDIRLKKTVGEKMPAGVVLVREAKDLVKALESGKADPKEAIMRFRSQELLLREGNVDEALENRRVEGDIKKKGGTGVVDRAAAVTPEVTPDEGEHGEEAVDEDSSDDPLAEAPVVQENAAAEEASDESQADKRGAPEGSRVNATDDMQDVSATVPQSAKRMNELFDDTRKPEPVRKFTPEEIANYRPAAPVSELEQVLTRIRQIEYDRKLGGHGKDERTGRYPPHGELSQLRRRRDELRAEQGAAQLEAEIFGEVNANYNPEGWDKVEGTNGPRWDEATETRTSFIQRTATANPTFRQAMAKAMDSFLQNVTGPDRVIMPAFVNRIAGLVRDVPVYILPDNAFYQLKGLNAGAYYDVGQDYIVMPASVAQGGSAVHILLHEGVHAAFLRVTQHLPHVRGMVMRIAQELKKRSMGTEYEFQDFDEFIAEANSNSTTMRALMNTKASPGLAMIIAQNRRLPVNMRIRSLWDALVNVVADALGFTGGRNYTLLDAMMQVNSELEFGVRELGRMAPLSDAMLNENYAKSLEAPNSPWTDRAKYMRVDALTPNLDTTRARHAFGDHNTAFQNWVQRNVVKFLTFDQMKQQSRGSVFESAMEKLVNALSAQDPMRTKFREAYDKLAQKFMDYSKSNPDEAEEFADIGIEATNLNARLVDGKTALDILDAAENKHIKGDATVNWQAQERLGALQDRYNKMTPAGKALFQEMSNWYREAHNELVKGSVEAVLDKDIVGHLTPAQKADILKRTLAGTLTDADRADKGGILPVQIFNLLGKEADFRAVRGTYFPRMRYGDHVVVGRDTIKDTHGGTLEGDDTVLFRDPAMSNARKRAKAYVKASPYHFLQMTHVYFDGNTGKEVTLDASKSLNNVEHGYRVKVQTKGVYMFESAAEAAKFARENPEGHDKIGGVEDRLGLGYNPHMMTGTQVATLMSSLAQRDDITKGEKELLRTVITHAAARMLRGNRITSRRLKSKKVTGASKDFARNILNYGDAAGRHLATAVAMPKIREALGEMRDENANYEGKDKNKLNQLYNETIKRIDEGTIEPNQPGKVMQDILQVSFFTRLASPAYSLINGMQVIMVSAPVLGGRYGNARAYHSLMKAYADMGFSQALLGGMMNTARAAKQWGRAGLTGTDNLLENTMKRLDKQPDGAALRKMMGTLIEGNAVSTTAGFETSEAIAAGRGQLGHAIAKTDRIVRQLPQAIEIINRTVTAVAAYRLRRAEGYTHDEATSFAFDTVKNTQGDYTSSNAPRFFNNPYLRPAVQFKKYAQLYTYLIGDMVHTAFKNEDPAVRRMAQKQLINVFATQIAIAGMLSLPGLELVKAGFMITAALGLTGGWDDQEEKLKKLAEQSMGKDWAQMVTSGVITRAMGIDVSQRLSAADLWIFGEPKEYDAEGIGSWLLNTAAGSSGTMLLDARQGLSDVAAGDFGKGAAKLIPFKAFADAAKAANGKAAGPGEFALNAFGLRSARQAEEGRAMRLTAQRTANREATYKKLSRDYINAYTKGDRIKLRAKIKEWNKSTPQHYHVFPDSLDKYRKPHG